MANENWRDKNFGTLENSGKERAIDYLGDQSAMALVRAVFLIDQDEEAIGVEGSPFFITGEVNNITTPEDPDYVFLTNDPLPITGSVFLTNDPLPITGSVFLTNDPLPITGDVFLTNDPLPITGSVFITNNPVVITGTVSDEWSIAVINDVTASDNDKTLTVPADREYQVLSIQVDYYAFADVATRQLEIDFRDTDDNIFTQIRTGVTQTASTTGHYSIAPSLADHGAFRDTNYLMTPLPPTLFLQPNEDIRIWDNNATANDTMIVRVRVAERVV